MSITERNKNRKFECMVCIFSVLLIIFSMFNFDKNVMPYIYNDEFGYWVSSAKYAGYDWSGVFNQISYYSYGYGLILSLLLKITSNMSLAYKMALILNVIWLLGSFYILYFIGKKIYPKEKDEKILFISFLATCLPGNITQANYTWPENLLFFLFCLLTFVFLKTIEKPGAKKCIALSAISIFSYAVHQRTVVFIIAVSMALLLMLLIHKIRIRDIIVFFCSTALFFLLHSILKTDICNSIWVNGEALAINNLEGQVDKISSLFSILGCRNLVLSILGKLFYLVIVSIWLIYFFVEGIFVKLRKSILCLMNKKREDIDTFSIFLFLILIGSVGVGAIFMINPNGTVHVVYGRYNEHILGPLILVTLMELQNYKLSYKRLVCYFGITMLMACSVLYSIYLFSPNGTAELNSIGLASYIGKDAINVWEAVLVSMVEFVIIRRLLCIKSRWSKVGYILCLFIWLGLGYNAYDLFSSNGLEYAVSSTEQCVDVIEDFEKNYGNVDLIYAMSGKISYPTIFSGNGIQYCMPSKEIKYITEEELNEGKYKEKSFLVFPVELEKPEGFNILLKTGFYYVAIPEAYMQSVK